MPTRRPRRKRSRWLRVFPEVGRYAAAFLAFCTLMFPLYSVVLTSVQREVDIRSRDVALIPRYITLEHYHTVLQPGHIVPIREAMLNSLIVSLGAASLSLALAAVAAYAVARLRMWGRELILYGMVSVYLFPTILFVIPLFVLITRLGLVDTYVSLIVPYAAFVLPLLALVLRGFFRSLPEEVEHAALIDGCG